MMAEEGHTPMTAALKKRLAALSRLQNEHDTIHEELEAEIIELERKFHARFAPLYEKRAALVSGKAEPTGDEGLSKDDEDDEDAGDPEDDEGAEPVEGVPHFWLRALGQCSSTESMIQEHDLPILEHLQDIKLTLLEGAGFQLEFVFSANPFFTNTSLVKRYEANESDNADYLLAKGCQINWKEGKDVTHTVTKKKQKNKKTGQVRMVTRKEKCESFFNFFSPPEMPPMPEDDEDLPEGFEELAEAAQLDVDIGEAIKEKLIPQAVLYYLGIADSDDEYDGEEFEEDDEDDEDDDDDDNSDV